LSKRAAKRAEKQSARDKVRSAEILDEVRERMREKDFASVAMLLEDIPEGYETQESLDLLRKAKIRVEQSEKLLQQIDQAVEQDQTSRLLPKLDDYLKLVSTDERIESLREKLAAEQRKFRWKVIAGITGVCFVIVAEIVAMYLQSRADEKAQAIATAVESQSWATVLTLDSGNTQALLGRARNRLNADHPDFEGALSDLQSAENEEPGTEGLSALKATVYARRAGVQADADKIVKAEADLKEARTSGLAPAELANVRGKLAGAHLRLAQGLAAAGQLSQAIASRDQAVGYGADAAAIQSLTDGLADAYLKQAELLTLASKYAEALDAVESAKLLNVGLSRIATLEAAVYVQRCEDTFTDAAFEEATAALATVSELEPNSESLPGLKDRLGKVLVAQGDAALADGSLPRVGAIIESLQTLDVLPDDQTRLADGLFTAASAALTAALEKQDLPSVVDAVKLVAGLKQEKRDRAIAVAVTPLSQMLLDGLKGDQPQQAATVLADLAVVMPELATALQDVVKELSDEVKAMLPATLRRLAPPDWLNDGLVAYYPFNGNAKDESGNGNDGEVRGTTPSSDRFDTLNRSYFFDGVNDGIVLPDFKNLNVGPGSFTLNAWVLPRADKGIIIDKYSRKDTRCISLAHNIGDKSKGEVALFLRGLRYEDDLLLNSTQSLNRNAWQLVTAVKNAATSRYSLYVDGQLRSVGNWNGNHHVPAAWNIGMRAVGGADSYFKGSIDDVRIYNLALSADNVKALYGYESLPPLSDSVQAPSSDVAPFDAAQAKAHQQAWA
ncbi:MAG: LamG-like jellyroll fold domain-containing protein, partial [Planctomycetales bacterium]